MTAESILFALLCTAVCNGTLDDEVVDACTPEMLDTVHSLAQKHDLAHLAGYLLEKQDLPDCDALAKFKMAKMRAIYRYAKLDYEFEQICNVLEDAEIPFIPLKGSILRAYYPEPWMRTSCDVDILVQEEILDKAAAVLVERLGYSSKGKSDHDISMLSASGVHLDLHYVAVDKDRFAKAQAVLGRMWEDAKKTESSGCHKVLTDEMFYFYHIAHMAKHIENGGCGIRPFLDLWILNHRITFDREKRNQLLKEGNLLTFAAAAEKLSEIWFSLEETDQMSQQFERYVLRGGTYGIMENQISVYQSKLGGRCRYALQKIFLPYDRLKYHYPVLQKYKILTPIFEVVRWLKLLFKGGVKRSVHELQINAAVSDEAKGETECMLSYLGLGKY